MNLILPIIIWAVLYYVIFRFSIEKFNLKTPGTEEDGDVELRTKDEYREEHGIGQTAGTSGLSKEDETSYQITQGLGGSDNIDSFTNCATRLRVTVKDGDKVNENLLRKTGAAGVMASGQSVQVIYGTKVEGIAGDLNDFLKQNPNMGNENTAQPVAEPETESVDPIEDDSDEIVEMNGEIAVSPMTGKIVPLENVNDEVFSSKMMGDGIAILPSDGKVYAPVSGEVTVTMDSNHAVGLASENGAEILIHVGLDTVELAGEGFITHIQKGDHVEAGDLLIEADLELIKEKGYDTTTIIVVTNTMEYKEIKTTQNETISHSDELLELVPDNE